MYTLATILTSMAAFSSLGLAAPLTSKRQSDPECVNGHKKLFLPTLHNIYVYKDVAPFPSTSTVFNIMDGSSTGSSQKQVAQWTGIPSTATECMVGWAMQAERSFSVYDNGLARWEQMTGLPEGDITVDTIEPFLSSTTPRGGLDFTSWPETTGPRSSIGGLANCGSEVIIQVSKNTVNAGPGSITLEQTELDGLFLEINC